MFRTIIIIAILFLFAGNLFAEEPLQLCEPGQPGFIEWNKSQFCVGDTVWVFNADGIAHIRDGEILEMGYIYDRNDYLLPYSFCVAEKGVLTEVHKGQAYRVKLILSGYEMALVHPRYDYHIPQQRAVFFHL